MKKAFILSSLVLSLSISSAFADCLSKATAERDYIQTNYSKVFNKTGQIILVFTNTPIFLGYHAVAFMAKDRYYDLKDLVQLIEDAKSGDGEQLEKLQNDLKTARPDISKEQLAKKLVEADKKELFCENSSIAGRLLRNLIADGSIDEALTTGEAINLQNNTIRD